MRWLVTLLMAGSLFFTAADSALAKRAVIREGSQVEFDYTLSVDGNVVNSTKESGPFKFVQGKSEVLPGLAKQLNGMGVGEEKTVVLSPDQAYGQIDLQGFREIAKKDLPPNIVPQPGMFLPMNGPDGRAFPVRIVKVENDKVIVDFNHPLAGKTLSFQVKIVSIK